MVLLYECSENLLSSTYVKFCFFIIYMRYFICLNDDLYSILYNGISPLILYTSDIILNNDDKKFILYIGNCERFPVGLLKYSTQILFNMLSHR